MYGLIQRCDTDTKKGTQKEYARMLILLVPVICALKTMIN